MADALRRQLIAHIGCHGPLGLDAFMQLALLHRPQGYYVRGEGIGRAGDFITAPEISPLLGQALATWVNQAHARLGNPSWRLVELGPGRGTLLVTLLPHLTRQPAQIHLVEASPTFQRQIAARLDREVQFVEDLGLLPESALPTIFIANEYFDALPVQQYQRHQGQQFEICVGLEADELIFVRRAAAAAACPLPDHADGWWELCPAALAQVKFIAKELRASGGAALIIDYGYARAPGRPTFQALQNHRIANPLAAPGQADLSALVDFGALVQAVESTGLRTRLETQQQLLLRLDFGALLAAQPGEAAAAARLVRDEAMGRLFHALSCFAPLPEPAAEPAP